jgi:hypothetical protein
MITVLALCLHLVVLNLCRRSECLSDVGAALRTPKAYIVAAYRGAPRGQRSSQAIGHAYTEGWPGPVYSLLELSCTSARGETLSIIRKCLFPRIAEDMSEVTPPMVSLACGLPYVLEFFSRINCLVLTILHFR